MKTVCVSTKIFLIVSTYLFSLQSLAQHKIETVSSPKTFHYNKGHFINAHGAGILYYKGVYYLYGEIKSGKTWFVPNQQWEDYRVPAGGVSCYSSKDLLHWKYEGVALETNIGNGNSDLDTGRVVERPKVIYNAVTKKFVMWMHIDKNDYSYARVGVAVSDSPKGPFTYLKSISPNDQQSRDMTVFQDDDGKAYLIYSSENNNTMHVCRLSEDYLTTVKDYKRIFVNERREAPAMFRYKGKYFLITSSCTGWSPNAAGYAVSDSPLGDFKMIGNPCKGSGADTTFGAQSTYVLPVKNKGGVYLFMADKWNKTDLPYSSYLWLPLIIKGDSITIINHH